MTQDQSVRVRMCLLDDLAKRRAERGGENLRGCWTISERESDTTPDFKLRNSVGGSASVTKVSSVNFKKYIWKPITDWSWSFEFEIDPEGLKPKYICKVAK